MHVYILILKTQKTRGNWKNVSNIDFNVLKIIITCVYYALIKKKNVEKYLISNEKISAACHVAHLCGGAFTGVHHIHHSVTCIFSGNFWIPSLNQTTLRLTPLHVFSFFSAAEICSKSALAPRTARRKRARAASCNIHKEQQGAESNQSNISGSAPNGYYVTGRMAVPRYYSICVLL